MKSVDTIEDMILKHIKDIDSRITDYHKEVDAELMKAKSIALQSLAELRKADKM